MLRVSKIDLFVSLNLSRNTKNININALASMLIQPGRFTSIMNVMIKYIPMGTSPNEDITATFVCRERERDREREPPIHPL
jgi:hypothetical protein